MKDSPIKREVEYLYEKGRKGFEDLQADEATTLAGKLILHGDKDTVRDILGNLGDPNSILFPLGIYMTTWDTDYRTDMMDQFMQQVAKFYEVTINKLFEEYAEEVDQIENEHMTWYEKKGYTFGDIHNPL